VIFLGDFSFVRIFLKNYRVTMTTTLDTSSPENTMILSARRGFLHACIFYVACKLVSIYGCPQVYHDTLEITRGTLGSARNSILEFVSCKCKKGCQTKRCSCFKANLKCTELSQCSNCENSEINEEQLIGNDFAKEAMDCDYHHDEFL
jgi:hypothetical protein